MLAVFRKPREALDYAKRIITSLYRNEIDVSLLIISKELTKTQEVIFDICRICLLTEPFLFRAIMPNKLMQFWPSECANAIL